MPRFFWSRAIENNILVIRIMDLVESDLEDLPISFPSKCLKSRGYIIDFTKMPKLGDRLRGIFLRAIKEWETENNPIVLTGMSDEVAEAFNQERCSCLAATDVECAKILIEEILDYFQTISVKLNQGVCVVTLKKGQIVTGEDFNIMCAELFSLLRLRKIIFDCSDVRRLDRAIIVAFNRFDRFRKMNNLGFFRLSGVEEKIKTEFDLLKVRKEFAFDDSLDEAIRSFD